MPLLLACNELARAGDGACHPLMRNISIALDHLHSTVRRRRCGRWRAAGGTCELQRKHTRKGQFSERGGVVPADDSETYDTRGSLKSTAARLEPRPGLPRGRRAPLTDRPAAARTPRRMPGCTRGHGRLPLNEGGYESKRCAKSTARHDLTSPSHWPTAPRRRHENVVLKSTRRRPPP